MIRRVYPGVAFCVFSIFAASAGAQNPLANYPNKPLRLIIPFAPGGTPASIQERLVNEVRKSHGSASVRAALERDGADPVFLGGSEFAQFFIRDLDKYIRLVKQAGVKAEQ